MSPVICEDRRRSCRRIEIVVAAEGCHESSCSSLHDCNALGQRSDMEVERICFSSQRVTAFAESRM